MKKVIYSALMMGALAFGTTSCTKTCDAGYEGSDCKTEVRTKFLANNKVTTDNCAGSGYNMSITADSDVEYVVFSNLGNFSTPAVVKAKVDGTALSFTSFIDATGRKFTGTGTLAGNTITLTYTVVYTDNTSESCNVSIAL
jgi:hypothetical protein